MIELDMNRTNVIPIDFHEIEWAYFELDLTPEIIDFKSLSAKISSLVTDYVSGRDIKYICRVALRGRTVLYKELNEPSNISFLEDDLCNELDLLDLEIKTDAITRNVDLEALKREETVLSYALNQLENCSESLELMRRMYALPIFPRGMTDTEKKDFILSKFEKVQNEIVNRMVRNDYDY